MKVKKKKKASKIYSTALKLKNTARDGIGAVMSKLWLY